MDGWIDGLMDGWTDGLMSERIGKWMRNIVFHSFSIGNSFISYHKSWSIIYSMRYSNLYQHLDYINQTLIQPLTINPNHLFYFEFFGK